VENDNVKEPGDSYLLYPNFKSYLSYGMRMLNYILGIKDVAKLKYLSSLSAENYIEIDKLLKTIIIKQDNDIQQSEYK